MAEKHPYMTPEKALAALADLFSVAFGHEKGSGEAYSEWCADRHLCAEWDGESTDPEFLPPSMWELLAAVGIAPDRFTEVLHVNPVIAEELKTMGYGSG